MKIARFQSLLASVVCIQPHLAWLLACVPTLVPANRREQVEGILEDLNLKFANLQGRALELEGTPIEVEDTCILTVNDGNLGLVEGPAVVVVGTENPTVAEWAETESILRNALAQVIVNRGEAELRAVGEKIEELEDGEGCGGGCSGQCCPINEDAVQRTDPLAPTNDFRADGRPDPRDDRNYPENF